MGKKEKEKTYILSRLLSKDGWLGREIPVSSMQLSIIQFTCTYHYRTADNTTYVERRHGILRIEITFSVM